MTEDQKEELYLLEQRLLLAAASYHYSDGAAAEYHKLVKLIGEIEEKVRGTSKRLQ